MAKNNVADLDTTAANNTDFAGTDSTGTTGLVKNGDNILRTIGAMLKKWWNDLGGTATVGGTANAITLTSASTYQSLVSGIRILFKPSADNSGATTLNLDSLGAKAIRKISGGTDIALTAKDLLSGKRAEVVYDSTANAAAGAWILLDANISLTASVTGTLPVANGGTGLATITANNVLLGNGTSAMQVVAPGTSGNVLTSDGTTWASTALPASGGLTLLGTLTTTSGTTQTLSGLTLTGYKRLYLVLNGVSGTGSNSATLTINGHTIAGGIVSPANSWSGWVEIDLTTGVQNSSVLLSTGADVSAAPSASGLTTASTSVTVAITTGGPTFDAGSIPIYGVK